MGQSLTYLAKQGKRAKPKALGALAQAPAKPKKPRGGKQAPISMPSEAMASLVDAEGTQSEITWIEDVLGLQWQTLSWPL